VTEIAQACSEERRTRCVWRAHSRDG
jgi:hypothetical protein